MNHRYLLLTPLLTSLFLFGGCATYKQLKPKAPLSPVEQGYLEIKQEQKEFELKKNNKYYIAYPAAQDNNFYLILNIADKSKLRSSATAELLKESKPGVKLPDESPYPDTISAYPVGKSASVYYWLIDTVPADMVLKVKYRYVPQWRYKFETHHTRFRATFQQNLVDRKVYKGISSAASLNGFNYPLAMDTIGKHSAKLDKLHAELLAIENIFPASILNSKDVAYQNYVTLKKELEEEIAFQNNFRATLEFFYLEEQSKGNPFEFLARIENFIGYFANKQRYADNVLNTAKTIMNTRLAELPAAYDQRLTIKDDAKILNADYFRLAQLGRINALYDSMGTSITPELALLSKFVIDFNTKSAIVLVLRDSLDKIVKDVSEGPAMPGDDFFRSIVERMNTLGKSAPTPIDAAYGKYQSFKCATALNLIISQLKTDGAKLMTGYQQAESVVAQVNGFKARTDYASMITVLRQNMGLQFLIDKYRDLDRISVSEQTRAITSMLESGGWPQAETALQKLHTDQNFLNPSGIIAQKESAVRDLEDSLYTRVERLTRTKVNQFCEEKISVLENVDSLYSDSVFLPTYNITFSSGSAKKLVDRKNQLVTDLAKLKENEFPAKAIKLLYEQFIKNPDDNGVLKARAIVTHSKHYTGTDKDLKIRVAEVNPLLPKLISKPTDYRRIFVMPVTDNRRGKNKYVFRINVNIPTEAMFPVYDVNVKLPKEVAQNAAASQWFDEMLLNKKQLKNEGRFTITAPGPANEYECQITPVQMNKDQNNILEVSFTYPAFKVFSVSAMVQKPIIKKN